MNNIVIDIQSLQTVSRFRGIGRSTLELIRSIAVSVDSGCKIFLLYNTLRELPIEFKDEFKNLECELLGFSPFEDSNSNIEDCLEISEQIKTMVVKSINPNLYIGPNLFEGFDTPVYGNPIKGLKNLVFFYDAIPLQFPEKYLPNVELKSWYLNRIDLLKTYDLILTLSKASIQDLKNLMSVGDSKIKYIGGGYRKIDRVKPKRDPISEITYLYFGAFDSRKNVSLLIKAFAKMQEMQNSQTKLIIAGHVLNYQLEIEPLKRLAAELKLNGKVEFRGYVKNSEIDDLFDQADVYVQTSLAEGLGLGLLDAIAHEVPAIALSIPSAAEVLGGDNYLFENNIESLAYKMSSLAIDRRLRDEVKEKQSIHAENLKWDHSAARIIEEFTASDNFQVTNIQYFARKSFSETLNNIRNMIFRGEKNSEGISTAIAKNFSDTRKVKMKVQTQSKLDIKSIYIEGHLAGTYSLSILNREFSTTLRQLHENTFSEEIFHDNTKGNFNYGRPIDENHQKDKFIISRNVYPPIAQDMQGKWNFYHCFNWEETVFPSEYVMQFNNFLDGVTCASKEVQKALIDSGVGIPTRVVGLSRLVSREPKLDKPNNSRSFVFLHISSGFPRKGVDILLTAFESEFDGVNDVSLIIKTFPNPHQNVMHDVSKILSSETRSRIQVIQEDYSDEEMQDLYDKADCLIQPTRGEGFGLPIFEAINRGIKVVATKWGGHMDFYYDALKYGIDYQMEMSNSHLSEGNSLWAEPNVNSLREKMRTVYSEGKYARDVKGILPTWTDSARKQLDFINEIMNRLPITPRIGLISSWDTKCGIAEYSLNLMENFDEREIVIFAPHETKLLLKSPKIKQIRCWNPGIGDVKQLIQKINVEKINVIFIQFNFGFFSITQFRQLLLETKNYIRVIELHSLRSPTGETNDYLLAVHDLLFDVDRILVHNLKDLNLLHDLGLSNQAILFPLPNVNFGKEISYNIKKQSKVIIGTSGFSLPHKGHLQLIDAASELSQMGVEVELRLYTPEHPDPSSKIHLSRIKKLIEKVGNVQIVLDETFYDENELVSNLSNCDLVVYPHQITGESASASVQHGLASGKPVLVTPSSIFSDMDNYFYVLPGFEAIDIVNGISQTISMLKSEPGRAEKELNVQERIRANTFQSAAFKLRGIFLGLLNKV